MSIKQRLEYGIFPIASRRHQPRDNSSTFHEFSHDWTKEESSFIVIMWVFVPIFAAFGAALGRFSFGECLFFFILLALFVTWEIKHS